MIKVFQKRKVFARFKKNIWVLDLAERKWLSSFNCGIKYLLCVINIWNMHYFFKKYAWVKLMKYKKDKAVLHGFI